MRIRIQLLLPLAVALLVSAGFALAALTVGAVVRSALPADPEAAAAAAEGAIRTVLLWGLLALVLAVVAAIGIARMIAIPLTRMRAAARRIGEPGDEPEDDSPVAEIQDIARGISRAAGELRDRHGRELRERSELAALVEAVSEGILQLAPDGRLVRSNRAAHALLGLPPDAVGRPVGALVRNAELRRLLERSTVGDRVEPTEVVLDDRRILVSVTTQAGAGAVATFVDLTDLRRLEEIRRDFVANASHELKTPLTSIRGYTETLLSGDLPPSEQRQFLATISRNAERLQRIVDDLLDLSRLESGRWQPELEMVDVMDLARAAWGSFADRAERRDVAFSTATDDGPTAALADRRALEQVFANLYDNALRHTPPGGAIRVSIRAAAPGPSGQRMGAAPTPWLGVEVTDTGSGIPRDALQRVFERFYRVDPARSRAEGGTGLGLSIVKHMLDGMGGAVAAESELGKGTTIRFWLRRPERRE
jgi:signal transduction histidine kinase